MLNAVSKLRTLMLLGFWGLTGCSLPTSQNDGEPDPGAMTCELIAAPEGVRRIPSHGVDLLIFPAKIGESYTGCEVVWLEDGRKLATRYFENGKLVWELGQEPKKKRGFFCRYSQDKLLKARSSNTCPDTAGYFK